MKVRDAGYQKWDCHTPYAMHGMDEAMGLKPTRIGIISFIFGMLGVATAVFMMQYTNAFSFNLLNIGSGYPLVVGGKPPHIIKLPMHNHPIFESDRFEAASDDKYFISIEAGDQKFDLDRTKALLEATNPTYLELVEEEVQ